MLDKWEYVAMIYSHAIDVVKLFSSREMHTVNLLHLECMQVCNA